MVKSFGVVSSSGVGAVWRVGRQPGHGGWLPAWPWTLLVGIAVIGVMVPASLARPAVHPLPTISWTAANDSCVVPVDAGQVSIAGVHVVPHRQSEQLKWRRPASFDLGARVELFLRNDGPDDCEFPTADTWRFDGNPAAALVDQEQWAWHDSPEVWTELPTLWPTNTIAVISWNGCGGDWGPGTQHRLAWQSTSETGGESFELPQPAVWLSTLSLGASADPLAVDGMVGFVKWNHGQAWRVQTLHVWLPLPDSPMLYRRASTHAVSPDSQVATKLPASGGMVRFEITGANWPRSMAIIEVQVQAPDGRETTLWSHQRLKPEAFDISGGWVAAGTKDGNVLSDIHFLKTLRRLYVNAGQIEEVSGYTDQPDLYEQYPLKRFNRLADWQRYSMPEYLPYVHAVEFLGEPQYGGGRPVPPQEVFQSLAPYRRSALPTSVTLSEERNWRLYAGLSDYPHYDAYRVIAPAADAWNQYDRWNGQRIRWGAPLETIGEMTRSLRELSRPRPIAYWSQGAHDGWGNVFSPRRRSPNPAELRAQAWHGLANKITSLYWFNLSLKSLLAFPDLMLPIAQIGREIRMFEPIFLTGDVFEYRRLESEGRPAWDLSSIVTDDSLLMIANDLDYEPDPEKREFQFRTRRAVHEFQLPEFLRESVDVFRVDHRGVQDVEFAIVGQRVTIVDDVDVVGIYMASCNLERRQEMVKKWSELLMSESEVGFDPIGDAADLEVLRELSSRLRD